MSVAMGTLAALPAYGHLSSERSLFRSLFPTTCKQHELVCGLHWSPREKHMSPMTLKNKMNGMKATLYRACLLLLLRVSSSSVAWAKAPEPDSAAPLLTLDEAIRIATGNNRDIRISSLDITKAKEAVVQARTNYLPKLDTYVLA